MRRWIRVVVVVMLVCPSGAGAVLRWVPRTIDPASSHAPGFVAVTLACPSPTECVAVSAAGELTFDPASPSHVAPTALPLDTPGDIICPTSTQCTALDTLDYTEVTFDPTAPEGLKSVALMPHHPETGMIQGISCPSASLCVALDDAGNVISFDPAAPRPARARLAKPPVNLRALSCPAATQCTAVTGNGVAVTFNPSEPATATSGHPGNDSGFSSMTCASTTACSAVDPSGTLVQFDPTMLGATPAEATSTPVPKNIFSEACPSLTLCTAVGGRGEEVSYDPATRVTQPAVMLDAHPRDFSSVSCASVAACVAVDGAGAAISYDPGAPVVSQGTPLDLAPVVVSAVACPSAAQCTAVDRAGNEATFDPLTTAPSTVAALEPEGTPLTAIACPTTAQCTAIDQTGHAISFDPAAPSAAAPVAIASAKPALTGIACPSVHACVAIGPSAEISFDPARTQGARRTVLKRAADYTGIACPAATACTAVSAFEFGAGQGASLGALESTFNPSGGALSSGTISSDAPARSVACPKTTVCVALQGDGYIDTFNPRSTALHGQVHDAKAFQARSTIEVYGQIACLSRSDCVAVDRGPSLASGSPAGRAWTRQATPADTLQAVACVPGRECVAIDASGDAVATP